MYTPDAAADGLCRIFFWLCISYYEIFNRNLSNRNRLDDSARAARHRRCLPLRSSAMRRRLHQVKIVTPLDAGEHSPLKEEGVTIKPDVSVHRNHSGDRNIVLLQETMMKNRTRRR